MPGGVLTPAFLLVAVTGGLELADVEGTLTETEIDFPSETILDFSAPTLKTDVDRLLEAQGLDVRFEGLRVRGDRLTTIPTTRNFVRLALAEDGLTGTFLQPDLHYTLMELHKGHGPLAFQIYMILCAIALCLIVFGGVVIGLLAATYRTLTLAMLGVGAAAFCGLAVI